MLAILTRQSAAWTLNASRSSSRASSCSARMITSLSADATAPATESSATTVTANGRLSRQNLSLDVRTIVSETDMVLSHLKSRRASTEALEAATTIATLQSKRVALIQARDSFLNQRKEASAQVGQLMRKLNSKDDDDEGGDGVDAAAEVEKQKSLSAEAAEGAAKADEELDSIQTVMDDLLAGIPNLLDDKVPDGDDETQNVVVSDWGDIGALPKQLEWTDDFEPKWHDDIAMGLQGYQSEAAVKMSGARFVALSGPIARLERSISMFFLDLHTTKHGYTEVSVPYLVGRSALEGTSQLPKFQDDLFAISPESHTCNGEDAFLIPTAEVPLTNLHADSIFEEKDLPISYVAWTPCFRAEAGSSGRDTKGLIRTHQFQKVELVKITTADASDDQHEILTGHAEACLQALELPYRKVRLCSGDIGFSARHCYDLEVWLPGAGEYREISSCSNTGDFQARRMSMRYRPDPPPAPEVEAGKKKKKPKKMKPELCHTINGSGLAVGRTLVAVLENYQRADGSVVVPEVLRPYMGGVEVLEV
jgi:seryl-tRNA synthetase